MSGLEDFPLKSSIVVWIIALGVFLRLRDEKAFRKIHRSLRKTCKYLLSWCSPLQSRSFTLRTLAHKIKKEMLQCFIHLLIKISRNCQAKLSRKVKAQKTSETLSGEWHKSNRCWLITMIAHHLYSLIAACRSHRSTVLGNNASRETTGNIFAELTGMISSNPAAASTLHQACNNRLNAVPSNEGNYHSSNSNNSPTQLSSSLSAIHTSIQAPTITTTQISQAKSRLSINHSCSDDDFGSRRTNEINLHPTKHTTSSHLNVITNVSGGNGINYSDDCQSHENNGMVTIVTINSLSSESGNSIAWN